MASEDRMIFSVVLALLLVIGALIGAGIYCGIQWQPRDFALRQSCVQDGGIWLEDSHAMCVWSERPSP